MRVLTALQAAAAWWVHGRVMPRDGRFIGLVLAFIYISRWRALVDITPFARWNVEGGFPLVSSADLALRVYLEGSRDSCPCRATTAHRRTGGRYAIHKSGIASCNR